MATLAELSAQIQALDAAADASYAAVHAVRDVKPPNVQADLGLIAKANADIEALLLKIDESEKTFPASVMALLPLRNKLKAHYQELKEWQTELTNIVSGQTPPPASALPPPPVASSTAIFPQQTFLPSPETIVIPGGAAPMDLSPVLVPAAGGLIGYLVRQTPMGAAIGALAGIAYEIFIRKDR